MNLHLPRSTQVAGAHALSVDLAVYFLLAATLAPLAQSQPANLTLTNANLTSGTTIYQATNSITTTSGDSFTVSGSASVIFQAGSSITLLPGFRATALNGAITFHVYIAPIVDYTISGTVTAGSSGLSGVTMTLSGSQSGSTTTASNGAYSFTVAASGNYTVTPSMTSQTFSPTSMSVSNIGSNQVGNFSENNPLLTFASCVGLSGTAQNPRMCILPGSNGQPNDAFTVDQPIVVTGSYVVIGGSPDANNPTKLLRGHGLRCGIMELGRDASCNPTTASVTGITIQNLTFCGGAVSKQGDPNNQCPSTQETTCENNGNCDPDLYITNTGPGQQWSQGAGGPWTNPGASSYNVSITNCKFEDSPSSHNVFIAPSGVGQTVNDVYLMANTLSSGGVQIGEI